MKIEELFQYLHLKDLESLHLISEEASLLNLFSSGLIVKVVC